MCLQRRWRRCSRQSIGAVFNMSAQELRTYLICFLLGAGQVACLSPYGAVYWVPALVTNAGLLVRGVAVLRCAVGWQYGLTLHATLPACKCWEG